jgi:hypothetical protein
MAYAVGQSVEVCLEVDLPPARGVRRVVATFENERGEVAELTDDPGATSECVLQDPTQIGLQGQPDYPGSYELKRLRVEHLRGVTHADPPQIGFEVRGTP